LLLVAPLCRSQPTRPSVTTQDDPIARIRDEGMNRSQVMQTLSYLTDVIGPRLTASPNLKRANEWTRDRLTSFGLNNAHLEPWGPFGRGWSLKRFSAQVIEPQAIPLIAYPKAWSPGFDQPLVGDVVYIDARVEADLANYRGKLGGTIVLFSPPRDLEARWEPLATRMSDTDLLRHANADGGNAPTTGSPRSMSAAERRDMLAGAIGRVGAGRSATQPATTTQAAATSPTTRPDRSFALNRALWAMVAKEHVGVLVTPSPQFDGGTLLVSAATTPQSQATSRPTTGPSGATSRPSNTHPAWAKDAVDVPPQIVVATEQYNRLVRMIEQGARPRMEVDLQVQFHDDPDVITPCNTVAEIEGSDLKEQLVMVGGHLDSWHSGTGATDNGAGVAAAMEAVRIIRACDLHPRRTIRIALWTGEEEGLLGSKAYVAQHFGKYESTTQPATQPSTGPTTRPTFAGRRSGGRRFTGRGTEGGNSSATEPATTQSVARKLIRGEEYEKLSVYFNLDVGTGKIRGVYMQSNEAVRPIFRHWLAPFADMGAQTLSLSNMGGTDHLSFDDVGLPGFQFIQDPIEYWTRTHHTNFDVYDRIQAEDLKQASVILASFVYEAAMADERMPRKPLR
jgi:hypothetical protein